MKLKNTLLNRNTRYIIASALFFLISIAYLLYSGDFSKQNTIKITIITFTLLLFITLIVDVFIKFQRPTYFNYNEDMIHDIKWTWNWNLKKEILNLHPSCPACNNEVYYRFDTLSNKTEFICKSCNKQLANINSPHRNFATDFIKKTIIRKLKKENPNF